jgi:hypothetical protein
MNPICFYHKADLDGVCSAAIVKHFVPECELYGIDYGDEFPWDLVRPGPEAETDPLWMHLFKPENGYKCGDTWETFTVKKRTVYMVDFSLPVADMEKLTKVSNLVWIDHHKTAIDAAAEMQLNPRGMRSSEYAACELCWAWCAMDAQDKAMPDRGNCPDDIKFFAPPEAVRLLGRYDVWDKDHPEWESRILPFQYAIRSEEAIYDPECLRWRFLLAVDGYSQSLNTYIEAPWLDHAIERGAAILRYQAEVNRKACEAGAHYHTILAPMPGQISTAPYPYRALCCNTTTNNSQFFDGFFDPEKHDVMCAYSQRSDGKWKVSLYTTKDEIDCGAIAKSWGGGGHRGASGFICKGLPWLS